MSSSLMRITLGLALAAGVVVGQENTPARPEVPSSSSVDPEAADASQAEAKPPAEAKPAGDQPDKVPPVDAQALATKEKVRVLKPQEMAGEVMRLKSKADIKAEIRIRNVPGRPAMVFKGVVRNGKLIERLINRRFAPQKDVSHPRSGVRLWWSGNSDGYIFFRYTSIESVTITGKLSAKERAEILRRLRAGKTAEEAAKEKKAAAQAELKKHDLDNLPRAELESYLIAKFPLDQGWNSQRYRNLKRKQIIDEVELPREQALFVKYWKVLERVRYRDLRVSTKEKEKFEPGSADRKQGDGSQPGGSSGDKPAPAEEDE